VDDLARPLLLGARVNRIVSLAPSCTECLLAIGAGERLVGIDDHSEFKEFGVGLLFTPVIIDGVTVNPKVRPEVSSLDFSQGLQVSGFSIPVIRKNEAFTNVTLKDGESFAIAGLTNNEVRQAVATGAIQIAGRNGLDRPPPAQHSRVASYGAPYHNAPGKER
jgi:hypothetical protein